MVKGGDSETGGSWTGLRVPGEGTQESELLVHRMPGLTSLPQGEQGSIFGVNLRQKGASPSLSSSRIPVGEVGRGGGNDVKAP